VKRLATLALVLCAGCGGVTYVQTNVFVDEDGRIAQVEYGRSEEEHVNTFVSPVTGKTMDYSSHLAIRATLTQNVREKAWQCMNFLSSGTMYETDDQDWKFLVNGFTFSAYLRQKDGRYLETYRGVLCDTPGERAKKDERWKIIRPTEKKSATTQK